MYWHKISVHVLSETFLRNMLCLVYALVQCGRAFQSLRCIRSLRLSTKRTSAFSAEVFFRSLCYIYGRFVLFMFMFMIHDQWLSADVFSSFLLVSLLFIYSSYCSACLTVPQTNRPLLVTRLILTRHYWSCCLPIGHMWWLNYGRDRRHTSRPTNSAASTLHLWRIFQLRRPVPPTYHPRLVLIWRLHRRWPARDLRPRPLPKPLIVVRVPLRPHPSQMGP
jgi:hypothetical protein